MRCSTGVAATAPPSFRSPAMPPGGASGQSVRARRAARGRGTPRRRRHSPRSPSLSVRRPCPRSSSASPVRGDGSRPRSLLALTAVAVLATTGAAFAYAARRARPAARDLPPFQPVLGRRDGGRAGDPPRRAALHARRPAQHALLEPLGPAPRPPRRRRPSGRVRGARAVRRRRRAASTFRPGSCSPTCTDRRSSSATPSARFRPDEDALAPAAAGRSCSSWRQAVTSVA